MSINGFCEAEQCVVGIGALATEAGATIPNVDIAFRRWGTFRGDPHGANNLVVVEHALTADANAPEWWAGLIGPGLALDTDTYCVVCTNALGSCYGSTGPASLHPDGKPWGSRFPALSIRDVVAAEKALFDALGITRVHGIVGGSMGGARALEWTLSHPDFASTALVMAVGARASAWQIGIQSAQISAIENDPHWAGGDYYDARLAPDAGLATARRIAHLTYRGELEVDARFGTRAQEGHNPRGTHRDSAQQFAVNSYLEHQGRKLVERFDAGAYVTLTEALNRHDVGHGRGGVARALAESTVPTLVAGVDTDILYPFHQQEEMATHLGHSLGLRTISSPVGHDAFLTEKAQLADILKEFIAAAAVEARY